eukprot:jgi/Mesvir1/4777/Mv20970-RA.2
MIKNSEILSDLAQSKATSQLLQGLPRAPAFSLDIATDSAVLVAPSRAGKSTLTNAIARQTTFTPAEFAAAYKDLMPTGACEARLPKDLLPQITLVRNNKSGRHVHPGDGNNGHNHNNNSNREGEEEEEEDTSSSGSDGSVAGHGGGDRLSTLAFHPTNLKDIDEWVISVDKDPKYKKVLKGIKDAFDGNEHVPFRGPLLAVEENKASTLVPTAVTASSVHAPFQFVLEIPFISDSDIRNAINALRVYQRHDTGRRMDDSDMDSDEDPGVTDRDPVEEARARDLFGLSDLGKDEVVKAVKELNREGWKLPGHWKLVIGHKLVWRFQPKSFQAGAEAVHDFALKVLHGDWSLWQLVDASGVQLSIPGRIPALVDLPGIALDGSVRDIMLPRYLREFSANTYVFLVEWTGQMEGDVRQLARKEDFVRQALMLERERRQGREIDDVPPVLMFVAIFDRASIVRPHFTVQKIEELLKDEDYMDTFRKRIRVSLRDVLSGHDSEEGVREEDALLRPAEIDDLIAKAEADGAIQYQYVCTLRCNAKQDEMVQRLKGNVRRMYSLQNEVWMAWMRNCGSLILERQVGWDGGS